MTRFDPPPTERRLARMETALSRVREIRERGRAVLTQPDPAAALARELQVALQACLDAGVDLLQDGTDEGQDGRGIPESFAEVFDRLVELRVLPEELGRRLHAVADLRNRLVFDYVDLTPDDLFDDLDVLEDVEEFARCLRTRLEGVRDC